MRDDGAFGGPRVPVVRVGVRTGPVLGELLGVVVGEVLREGFLVVRRGRPVGVVVGLRVVHGRRTTVRVGGETVQMGEDGRRGRTAPGEGRVVQGQRPGLVVACPPQGRVLLVLGGFLRPRLDLAEPRGAVLVEGEQERGGPRGFFWLGPHQWPEPSSRERGRVKVT